MPIDFKKYVKSPREPLAPQRPAASITTPSTTPVAVATAPPRGVATGLANGWLNRSILDSIGNLAASRPPAQGKEGLGAVVRLSVWSVRPPVLRRAFDTSHERAIGQEALDALQYYVDYLWTNGDKRESNDLIIVFHLRKSSYVHRDGLDYSDISDPARLAALDLVETLKIKSPPRVPPRPSSVASKVNVAPARPVREPLAPKPKTPSRPVRPKAV